MRNPQTLQHNDSVLLSAFSRSSLIPPFACYLPCVMLFSKNQILFDWG